MSSTLLSSHLMSESLTRVLVGHQKLCCTGTCPDLRLRTPALPGATLLLQLGTTKWLRPRRGALLWSNHSHEAFPALAILTSYHLLSVDSHAQYLADRQRGWVVPLHGENVSLSRAWRLLTLSCRVTKILGRRQGDRDDFCPICGSSPPWHPGTAGRETQGCR